MRERSLRATPEGIKKAKKAFEDQGWTQGQMGEQIGKTRQPVGKFLAGKPIERAIFLDICLYLDLNWEEIAEPEKEQHQNNSLDIDALVQEIREKIKPSIQERCGTMRVLDMSQPIGLNDIYTNVNILERITGRQRKDIAELLQGCNSEDFNRFGLGRIKEQRVPGLEAVEKYTKLMILGKPGAGKTTFLKYVAIQCISGKFQANRVPIFVTLKDFAETSNQPSLLEYISQQFSTCGVTATQFTDLFNYSRTLVVLDGLDEVREEDNHRVLREIRDLSDQFRDNQFVITCRIAAREYTFEKFTEVEVADFDDEQIATFATNWFKNKAVKPKTFIKRLEDHNQIKQLAASPLLLTLLCLAFEESGDFPANRSELYKEGLDALLKKWDAKRGIQRDQVYKQLSILRKEDLLSKIALTTFRQCDYFFKQKTAEQYITDYIRNLPDANTDPEALQLDSEVVLRSIEYQHGLLVERAKAIYSFSHLTFHEYFTAREIVSGNQPLEDRLQNLVIHITDTRWREVFLLTVGMSPSADRLLQLMKHQVDGIVAADEKLQQFLEWVNKKSLSVQVPYKPCSVRAFYFAFAFERSIFKMILDTKLAHCLSRDLTNDFNDVFNNNSDREPASALVLDCFLLFELRVARNHALGGSGVSQYALEPELKRSLKQLQETLKDQLPNLSKDPKGHKFWWENDGLAWTEQLKNLMTKYRNIVHDWQLNEHQKEILDQYYDANLLLVDCLNSDCYVSRELREEIEETLLLPMAEIEKRKLMKLSD